MVEDNEKLANRNMDKAETKDANEILSAFNLPVFGHNRQVDQSEIQIQPINWDHAIENDRTRVLIMTHHRSGSSFTGELFNQHPDVFYMYDLGMKNDIFSPTR